MVARLKLDRSGFVATPSDEGIRDELTRLLFATALPQLIVGLSVAACSWSLLARTGDGAFQWLILAALFVMTCRVGLVILHKRRQAIWRGIVWERLYAAGNFAFSLVLAAFTLVSFTAPESVGRVMAATLVVAFCAGVVARASVRPWIAIPSIVISALPFAVLSLLQMTIEYTVIGLVILALIIGSLETVRDSYRITFEHLATRRRFAEMAALDELTGLPNRSMLMERLDDVFSRSHQLVAIHFLDLDHFKPVNDTYGHAAGDAILVEVSRRLRSVMSDGAFSARIGGDEFVVVQPQIDDETDARRMSASVVEALGWPYVVPGGAVVLGASDGCCIVETGNVTGPEAIAAADAALYEAKKDGRGRSIVRPYAAPPEREVG